VEGNEFIGELQKRITEVYTLPKIMTFYGPLKKSLQNCKIIDYYIKTQKSYLSASGSILESLFFDTKLIHWLVFDSASIKHSIFPIKEINSVYFSIINDQKTLDENDKPTNDELQLIVTFSGPEQNKICITSDTSNFFELLHIKNNLVTQISCQ
jgi:hypothetical protein